MKRQLMIYFIEQSGEAFNVYQTPMDTRHKFWVQHPKAKEISKKQYNDLLNQSTPKKEEANPWMPHDEYIKKKQFEDGLAIHNLGTSKQRKPLK